MKIFFLIVSIILLAGIVSADLIIEPSTMAIDTMVGEAKDVSITLNNTYNFEIRNVTFSNLTDLGFTFPDINLQPHEKKTIDFVVDRSQSYYGTINSIVSFRFVVDIPIEVKTWNVNITGTGYSPQDITIRNGDTISWMNKDDVTHSVTSAFFDFTLSPNQSSSYTFNNIGTVNYQDLILFYSGSVNVINRTEPYTAHNADYDKIFTVTLSSVLNPTILNVSTLEDYFEVGATGSSEGMLRLKNIGSELAERITFSSTSSWISFAENNISLTPQTIKYVKYTIAPLIQNTSQTNRTYNVDLKIKASNSNETTIPISFFITYSNVFQDYNTDVGFMTWFNNVYCPSHQELFICNTSKIPTNSTPQIIYRDPTIPVNMTVQDVYDMFKRIQKIEDSNARTDNQLKALADSLGITIPELQALLNQSITMQKNNEVSQSTWSDVRWIIGGAIFLSILVIVFIVIYNKYASKKNILEGGMNPTYR